MRRHRTIEGRREPPSAAPGLAGVPLRDLLAELAERGFEAQPAGVWRSVVGGLEAQLVSRTAALAGLVDGTEVVTELSHLAGIALPEAVAYATEMGEQARDWRQRAELAELQASELDGYVTELSDVILAEIGDPE